MKALTPFLIVIICVAMYFYYISPELEVINEKRAEYTKYKDVVDQVKEIKDLKDELSNKYQSIAQEDLEKLDKIIPQKFDPVLFANDLNALAAKHTLKMDQLRMTYQMSEDKVGEEGQIGDQVYREITSSFHLIGDYAKFLAFLTELETSLRLVDVTSLIIKSSAPANPNDKTAKPTDNKSGMDYSIEIKTYSLK